MSDREGDEIVWVASFDIGKKNFSFYIEEMNKTELEALPPTPKNARYNTDGTPTIRFKRILDQVILNGTAVIHHNFDLTENCQKGSYLDPESFHNMSDTLDHFHEYWDRCEVFVIEQQMSFGKNRNTMALKLGQHCYSYFAIKYGRFKKIIEFPAYHKTQVLGAKKNISVTKKGKTSWKALDKASRKKWAIEKAEQILADREDFFTLSDMLSHGKKDDLADTLCQCQAAKYLMYVEGSV